MQRKNVDKWKEQGVKDFVTNSLAGVCARKGVTKLNQITISLPYEAYPYLVQMSANLGEIRGTLVIYGQTIDFY